MSTIYELTVMEQNVIWELVSEARKRLLTAVRPDGFNIGLNEGLAAGQTAIHAHVHVIPRWNRDVPESRGGIGWGIADKAADWTKK